MKKYWLSYVVLIAACCLPAGRAVGQTYTRQQVVTTADSILRLHVGDSMVAHYRKKRVYCSYWGDSTSDGAVSHASITYELAYRYPHCPDLDTLRGDVKVMLNVTPGGELVLATPVVPVILPGIVVANSPCHFISRERARKIGSREKRMRGSKSMLARLYYDSQEREKFIWEVIAVKPDGREEGADIDAVTGKVLNRFARVRLQHVPGLEL
jgi:hypothetical protein